MLLEQIIEAVRDCSCIMMEAHDVGRAVSEKEGSANFVTLYDKKMQQALFRRLQEILPEAFFMGEEEENHVFRDTGYLFIVDPIDGTTNFIKNYKASSISVGLLKDGEPYIGVVYNPYLNEMFWAQKGKGAWCNGKQIFASQECLEHGICLMGTAPYYPELTDKTFAMARYFFDHSLDLRRSGSAAIDLCTVAAGRAELFFEARLSPWDFATGSLIVKEAGGEVLTLDHEPLTYAAPCSVLAMGAGVKSHTEDMKIFSMDGR